MGLQSLEVIFVFAIFGINHHGQLGKPVTSVNARIIPPAYAAESNSAKEEIQNRLANDPYADTLSYSDSESDEDQSNVSKPRFSRTDNSAAREKYPKFHPNDTDERRDEDRGTDGTNRKSSSFTTPFPAYTKLIRPITWRPLSTSRVQPPRPRTTVLPEPRVGVTIIAGYIPAQLGSPKQTINSSINGESDYDIGLVAGIFMGIFLIVGILIVFNIQCIRFRFR